MYSVSLTEDIQKMLYCANYKHIRDFSNLHACSEDH
jgi:hypothetical protein